MTLDLLVLHAARIRGMASVAEIADRFGLSPDEVEDEVLDQQAYGRLTWMEFGASAGWSLTDRGRVAGEQLLAAELDAAGARTDFESAYDGFLKLNGRLRSAVTDWQLRPTADDPVAANDHRDAVWDAGVLSELAALSSALPDLVRSFASRLPRFTGYDTRFARALDRAREGDREWVDGVGIDSCHSVWFELHEDLLATLGLTR